MRRFTANTVFFGFVRAWRLAIWPTSRSPLAVNPTMDGVVRAPSWFGITWGAPPSITATQEFVVPIRGRAVGVDLGALAQELVAQLVALTAQGLHLLAVEGRHRLHVHAGHAARFVGGRLRRVVAVIVAAVAGDGHDRSSLRVWFNARATCSTRAIIRPYSIRVLPTTPSPQAASASIRMLAVTSATWRRSGSGFSWPMVMRTPSRLRQALRIFTRRPFSSKALKSARMRVMSLSSGESRSLEVPSR